MFLRSLRVCIPCLWLTLTVSVYFSPRLSCHLFSPSPSSPLLLLSHSRLILGCPLSFLCLFFLHLWLFLPFSPCTCFSECCLMPLGWGPSLLFRFDSLEISVEMVTHPQTAACFFPIVLQEQMSWVECATESKSESPFIFFCMQHCSSVMREGFCFAEYLCPRDYAGPWLRITFREADPKKELLGEQYELAVHMWLYFGNSDSNSVDRRIQISGSHNLPL